MDLDEADPRVFGKVERKLESWLSQQVRAIGRRRAAGLAAVSAILAAALGGARRNILKNLSRHDRPLAGKLPGPDRFLFAELIELDDAALVTVFKAADPELIVLALAGASAELVKRITEQLPIEQGRALTRGLVHLGPTRLADVEEAQQALAGLAIDLEAEGRISLGSQRRISVAA